MSDNGKVAVALLVGLAAGAALGVLFAPERGSETRDKINDSLKDLGDALKERSAEQLDHVGDLADRVIAAVKTKLNKAEGMIEEEIEEHA